VFIIIIKLSVYMTGLTLRVKPGPDQECQNKKDSRAENMNCTTLAAKPNCNFSVHPFILAKFNFDSILYSDLIQKSYQFYGTNF